MQYSMRGKNARIVLTVLVRHMNNGPVFLINKHHYNFEIMEF